jgi:hypothetical protein
LLCRLRFRRARRELDDLLPCVRGTLQVTLAECQHDAFVEQRLRVLRIDLQRILELLERIVRTA